MDSPQKGDYKMMNKTKKIAMIGVLTALCTIVNTYISFTVGVGNKVSLVQSICFISGVITGPIGGFTVGSIGDIIGCLLQGESINLVIAFGNGLLGLIPGFLYHIFPKTKKPDGIFAYALLIISYVLCFIICTCCVNTFALWWFFTSKGKTFFVYLLTRIPSQSVITAINFGVSIILYVIITKTPQLNRFIFKKNDK